MEWITGEKGGKSMPDKWTPFTDIGISGTKDETMIDPEKVLSAINKFPDIEEDLKTTEKNLVEVSEPLEVKWLGTARGAYVRVEFYVQKEMQRIETKVANLYSEMVGVCLARRTIDHEASNKAMIN